MTDGALSRRTFMKGSAATALAAGGGSLLAGCGGGGTENTAENNANVKLPSYVPVTDVADPDLAGTEEGIQPAYFAYPKDRPKVYPEKPGSGGTVTGMANIYYAIPPTPPKNKYWAELNERLGVDLQIQMVPNADYERKFPTTIAGDDIPDFLQLQVVPKMPQLLEQQFADITKFVTGDAIKEYPNLANIPEISWKTTIYNGGIFGLPVPRAAVGTYVFAREDLFESASVSLEPKNYDEFHEMAKALTKPGTNQWAFGAATAVLTLANWMLGSPNGWREEGGKLTNTIETDEYRKALDVARQFWKEGLIHPDAFSESAPIKVWFGGGTICIDPTGYSGWAQYIQDNQGTVPGFKLNVLTVPGWDGGLGTPAFGGPSYATCGLKKADDDRIRELLRIADWLAAPFGSEEYLFRLYGIEGVDFEVDDNGEPVLTETGLRETVIPIRYFADCPAPIYQPGRPDDAKIQHAYQEQIIPRAVQNPTIGLFSDTNATDGAILTDNFEAVRDEVIQGRKPLSDLDGALDEWRSKGGDQIRSEYEDQLQKQGGKN